MNSEKGFRLKEGADSCLWYAVAREETLVPFQEQDRLEEGKIAFQVPRDLKWLFEDKGFDRLYAHHSDVVVVGGD